MDGDDPEHIQWIYQKSLERASQFNIKGVTYRLTQGKGMAFHQVVAFAPRLDCHSLYLLSLSWQLC